MHAAAIAACQGFQSHAAGFYVRQLYVRQFCINYTPIVRTYNTRNARTIHFLLYAKIRVRVCVYIYILNSLDAAQHACMSQTYIYLMFVCFSQLHGPVACQPHTKREAPGWFTVPSPRRCAQRTPAECRGPRGTETPGLSSP